MLAKVLICRKICFAVTILLPVILAACGGGSTDDSPVIESDPVIDVAIGGAGVKGPLVGDYWRTGLKATVDLSNSL